MSLKKYSKLLPDSYHYLIASCFSIYNQPELVPQIFVAARKDICNGTSGAKFEAVSAAEIHLARQFREALLRAGIFGGMSKAINSLQELHRVMPHSLREFALSADHPAIEAPFSDYSEGLHKGREFLEAVYGYEQSKSIEAALNGLSPRLGHYSVALVYGGVYADVSVLSIRQACVLMFLCNMCVDTPKQAIGHIDSSLRQGVKKQELLDVGIMVRTIAEMYSIKLKHWEQIMETADSDAPQNKNPYEI